MQLSHTERLTIARLALEGLSIGDSLGAFFEMSRPERLATLVSQQRLPQGIWHYTDDTQMTLSVYKILRAHQTIHQDALAESFVELYEQHRGYGAGTRALIARMRRGEHWRKATETFYKGDGSFGNGGAMRAAPIGAYFTDNLQTVINETRLATEITHAHPEGIAGAIAVAVAAAIAWRWKDRTDITTQVFLNEIIPHLPVTDVKNNCQIAADLPVDTTPLQAAQILGNGSDVSAQRTVPFALWCAGQYIMDYEQAIWHTLSVGGDTDTTCAIVGGIVALYVGEHGIPTSWKAQREPLPDWYG